MGISIYYSALEPSEQKVDEMCSFVVSEAREAGYKYNLVDVEASLFYSTSIDSYSKKNYKSALSYLKESYFRYVELPSYRDLQVMTGQAPPFVCAYIAKFTEEENRTERLFRRLDPLISSIIASDPKYAAAERRRRFYAYATPRISLNSNFEGGLKTRVKGVIVDNGVCETFNFLFARIGREWFLHDSAKTQPFRNDEVKECIKFHVFICECLRELQRMGGWRWRVYDEGEYYQTRNVETLTKNFETLGLLIYATALELEKIAKEVFGENSPSVEIGGYRLEDE